MCRDRAASEGTTDAAAPCRAPPHRRRARGARQGGPGARSPRSSHADWAAGPTGPTPSSCSRSRRRRRVPELVPIRYGRMLVSPFTFYRGGALPDGRRPRRRRRARAWTCSSAATRTSRTSASSRRPTAGWSSASTTSTRRCPGPFEWDVKRLAASFEVAGRDRGFDDAERAARSTATVGALPRGDARSSPAMTQPRALVRAPRRRADAASSSPRTRSAEGAASGFERNVAKARPKDSLQGVRQAHRASSTASRGSSATRR